MQKIATKTLLIILFAVLLVQSSTLLPVSADSEKIYWEQGMNDKSPTDSVVDTPMVEWTTGAINQQNSILTEGNILPPYPPNIPGHINYRAIIEGLSAGTYEVTISYQFTKGGKVAFDFLTTNYGISDDNLQTNLPGSYKDTEKPKIATLITNGPSTIQFPTDSFVLPDALGAGIVSDRQDVHDSVFGAESRLMKIYGATINSIVQGEHNGPITGDSHSSVTVRFTVPEDTSGFVILTWGAHLGIGTAAPTGYGSGNGAGSISGGPFHIALSYIIDTTTEKAVIKGSRDLAVLLKPALSVVPETPFAVAMMIAVGGAFVFYKRTQKRTD